MMDEFLAEVRQHLTERLIPFWEGLKDPEHGGYYGEVGFDLTVQKDAEKGCILNSRILWFFSQAYVTLGEERLLTAAAWAYRFLREFCLDTEYGGVYWSVNRDGSPRDDSKHTYCQAFAVYGLSAYYEASGEPGALELAEELLALMEDRCRDEQGYLEAFDRRFVPADNEKLSENGVMASRTMNTLLHVMEAYTELYRVGKNPGVAERIRWILGLIHERVYNREKKRQEVFFDKDWNSLLDLHSFGHDIETAWLLERTLKVLGDAAWTNRLSPMADCLRETVYQKAFRDHSLLNEEERGRADTTRIWWVQAEAVAGFFHGYRKNPEQKEYLEAALQIWDYIKTYLADPREGSEWFWAVDAGHKPLEKPIAEAWKCPYHNGRMCMELVRTGEA